MKTGREVSAGGVVFRRTGNKVEIALISVKGGKVWTLPKGLMEQGEGLARTAHREVREETGLDGKILKMISSIHYFYSRKKDGGFERVFKIVYFFLMEYTSGDTAFHDEEVEDCKWFPIDEAIEIVKFKDEKDILSKAKDMIGAGA
ncbi:MAG: NUDIX hydrolase [Deltaproteobacteria bacterium]|nr:NUDIX hydrolase [Deltaproteobacteria bacterium]